MQNIQEREKLLNNALEKTRQDLSAERKKPKDQRIHIETLESLQALLSESLSYLHFENNIWDERLRDYQGEVSTKEAVKWHEEYTLKQTEINELVRVKELDQQEHSQVLVENDTNKGPDIEPMDIELQKDILLRRQLAFDNLAVVVELLQDHLADLEKIRDARQLKFMKEKFLHVINSIWGLQLAVIQDRAITVGKSVTAILLFIAGLIIANIPVKHSQRFSRVLYQPARVMIR